MLLANHLLLNGLVPSLVLGTLLMSLAVFSMFFTATLHLRGYIAVARKRNSSLVKRAAAYACGLLVLMGIFTIASMWLVTFDPDAINSIYFQTIDFLLVALVGLTTIAGIALFVGMVRLYKQLGVFAIIGPLHLLWVFFPPYPWLAIIFIAPSIYFLYKQN